MNLSITKIAFATLLASTLLVALLTFIPTVSLSAGQAATSISLTPLGTYETGLFLESAAEIAAYDADNQRVYVVNSFDATVDVLDISDPTTPTLINQLDVSAYGPTPTSVDVYNGYVAVAVEAAVVTDPGTGVLFGPMGVELGSVPVGPLPDMVTFTPDGSRVLFANEGEPNDDYTVDPEGSITVVDLPPLPSNAAKATPADFRGVDVTTLDFNAFDNVPIDPRIRIFGPGATVSQDLEPEYIAVSDDGSMAWVTLQENNALAIIDLNAMEIVDLAALGYKNHIAPGNAMDASNEDGGIFIRRQPTAGMYQPDSIDYYEVNGQSFVVTANEGDARDYDGYSEEVRVDDLTLDPTAYPNAVELQMDENLGRLKTTTATGDTDGDGDIDIIHSYGARSFSIWDATGNLVYDSGRDIEYRTSLAIPDNFNANGDENEADARSDDKGPEPEAITVGELNGRTYAFVGLERVGGVISYDITNPYNVQFAGYNTNRDFTVEPGPGVGGDIGPESVEFVAAADSPTGTPLLIVAYEVSGTTTIFEISVGGQ